MLFAYTFSEGILDAKAGVGRSGGGRAGLAPALEVWEDPALGNKCNIINVISGSGRGVVPPPACSRTHCLTQLEEGGNLLESAFFENGLRA